MTVWVVVFCMLCWFIVHPKFATWAFVVLNGVAFMIGGAWYNLLLCLCVGYTAVWTVNYRTCKGYMPQMEPGNVLPRDWE